MDQKRWSPLPSHCPHPHDQSTKHSRNGDDNLRTNHHVDVDAVDYDSDRMNDSLHSSVSARASVVSSC